MPFRSPRLSPMNTSRFSSIAALAVASVTLATSSALAGQLTVESVAPQDGVIAVGTTAPDAVGSLTPTNKLDLTFATDSSGTVSWVVTDIGDTQLSTPQQIESINISDTTASTALSIDATYQELTSAGSSGGVPNIDNKLIRTLLIFNDGSTEASIPYFVVVDNIEPPTPVSVGALAGDGRVQLSWSQDKAVLTSAINAPISVTDTVANVSTPSVDTENNFAMVRVFYRLGEDFASASTETIAVDQIEPTLTTEGVSNTVIAPTVEDGDIKVALDDLDNGGIYYFAVQYIDSAGNPSDLDRDADGNIVTVKAEPLESYSLAEIAGIDDRCFVATAVMGSKDAPTLMRLRYFRDVVLRSNALGSWFVEAYYAHSPALAAWIADTPAARTLLQPVIVGSSWLAAASVGVAQSDAGLPGVALMWLLLLVVAVRLAQALRVALTSRVTARAVVALALLVAVASPLGQQARAADKKSTEPAAAEDSEQSKRDKQEEIERLKKEREERRKADAEEQGVSTERVRFGIGPGSFGNAQISSPSGAQTFTFEDIYGSGELQYELTWEYMLTHAFGVPTVGFRVGQVSFEGASLQQADTGGLELNTLNPNSFAAYGLAAHAAWHLTFIDRQVLMPFIGLGLDSVLAVEDSVEGDEEAIEFFRFGYDVRLGVTLDIGWLEPSAEYALQENYGIELVALDFEYRYSGLGWGMDDGSFGSVSALDLTNSHWSVGLAMEF